MQFQNMLQEYIYFPVRWKIISFLLKREISLSEREIAKLLNVSHMSVNRTMKELEDLNFVTSTIIGKAHVWKINKMSYACSVFSSMSKRFDEIKDPFSALCETILENLPLALIDRAVLFGSVSRREEKSNSDIDLHLLVKDEESKNQIEPSIDQLTILCLERFGNLISPYVLTRAELQARAELPLLAEIDKGLVLYPSQKSEGPADFSDAAYRRRRV